MIKIGMMIGDRYEILEKIGTGGMSDVYKAKCHKLNRYVAIKVLKQEFSENANFVSKFRIEAQAAAGLMHPNIVNVYDVGEENGIYYIVMELVEGITLKKYIEKKARLSYKEAVSIAIQVSMGIEAAHNNHIIHRDIKPQNIIISKDGKVKVTDFGIAKAATSNTITSNVMGSVHYTSPEQARGGYSDEKSDIYSLGITMFEMLTGRVPFNGETTVAIAIKHIQEEMPSPKEFVPEIPSSVASIVLKCCQKSPDRRYQNMAELIADLKQSLINPEEDFVVNKDPDMDAFGSAIGVYRMVNSMNKEAHIVINEVSSAISPIYGNFTANSMYGDDMIINNEQAIEMINADTMLVVVDVNNPSLTECEELISYAKTVVVFDHHRQTKDVIANATLSYVEPFASSACEMIAEMLQYMDEKIKLRPSEADAMYAGILIDTDNFLTKTGVRTFEAAAYLRRSGADVMRVRKMFRSDIDTYRQKADGVRNAEMVLGMFAVSVFEPKEGPESPTVLTAKVANEMLNIAGVRASFVIAQLGENVKISARSIDDVNVQIIMERMGGGGHANIAAAQFKNTTKEKVKKQLVNLLEEMYKEGDI